MNVFTLIINIKNKRTKNEEYSLPFGQMNRSCCPFSKKKKRRKLTNFTWFDSINQLNLCRSTVVMNWRWNKWNNTFSIKRKAQNKSYTFMFKWCRNVHIIEKKRTTHPTKYKIKIDVWKIDVVFYLMHFYTQPKTEHIRNSEWAYKHIFWVYYIYKLIKTHINMHELRTPHNSIKINNKVQDREGNAKLLEQAPKLIQRITNIFDAPWYVYAVFAYLGVRQHF